MMMVKICTKQTKKSIYKKKQTSLPILPCLLLTLSMYHSLKLKSKEN